MNEAQLKAVVEGIAKGMRPQLEALAKRIAALESRKALTYCGVFSRVTGAKAGDCTTHGGALWYALADTHDTPGTSAAWCLMAKSKS